MKRIKNSVRVSLLPIIIASFLILPLSGGNFALAAGNAEFGLSHKPVCPGAQNDKSVRCNSQVIVTPDGKPAASTGPAGLGPIQFHAAYTPVTTSASKKIIAIVDAYDSPTIYNDLTTYSKNFTIPVLPQCTGSVSSSSVPCFKKVDQRGGVSFPAFNSNWALEASLDVETAHAMCQNCSIILVESDSNGYDDLMAAIDRAVLEGANVISLSWGGGEFSTETSYDSHLNKSGIAIVASSGDYGYSVQYPASSPYVTAVGGTTLTLKNNDTTLYFGCIGKKCNEYFISGKLTEKEFSR